MNNLFQVFSVSLFLLTVLGCSKDTSILSVDGTQNPNLNPRREILTDCSPKVLDQEEGLSIRLIAGQNQVAGTVTVEKNGDAYTVCYQTAGDWLIQEVHLYVGPKDEVPLNKQGQPIPGHFPINETLKLATNNVCYDIHNLDSEFCGIIAAHAVVSREQGNETAWAEGCLFTKKNWFMYVDVCFNN